MTGKAISLVAMFGSIPNACPDGEARVVLTGLLLGLLATGATCIASHLIKAARARK